MLNVERVNVSVALVQNDEQEILFELDPEYGEFALPMTRQRGGASEAEKPDHAAMRAAARILGVPVRVGPRHRIEPLWLVSGRDFNLRPYRYDVFRAEPHADFAIANVPPLIMTPHLWLAPHVVLRGDYEPLSTSSRKIVAHLVEHGLVAGRSQYVSVVVIERQHRGKREFLLRQEPEWGYALPSRRRRRDESYAAAGERCVREELGLTPRRDLTLESPSEVVVTMRDRSRSAKVDTFYCHGVFFGSLTPAAKLSSARPLVWVDDDTIVRGEVQGAMLADDSGPAPASPISPTARFLLEKFERIPSPLLVSA